LPPNDPRLIGLLQQARALLLPSISETFGLVILEAWAAGTVVLSSTTSGARELIENGCNGWLFDLGRPASFHKSIDQILADPPLAKAMAKRGAARVEKEYDVLQVAGRMKTLY